MNLIKTFSRSVMAAMLFVMLSTTIDGFSLIDGANATTGQVKELSREAKARKRARKNAQIKAERQRLKKQERRKRLAKLQKQRDRKLKLASRNTKTKRSKQGQNKARQKIRKQQLAASNRKSNRRTSSASSEQTIVSTDTFNSVEIAPLRDLGIDRGRICFRVQAYSNTALSDLSSPVCTKIKNNKPLKLTWSEPENSVIGYRVFFGNTRGHSNNLLSDTVGVTSKKAKATLRRLL